MFARFAALFARYGPQELVAALAAVLGSVALSVHTSDPLLHGVVGSALEWLGYYGVALARFDDGPGGPGGTGGAANGTVAELSRRLSVLFQQNAAAELLDLILCPAAIALGVRWSGDPALGVFLGARAADVVFYTLVCRNAPALGRGAS